MLDVRRGLEEQAAALESSRAGLRHVRSAAQWDAILRIHHDIAEAIVIGDAVHARLCMRIHFDSALGRLERGQDNTNNEQHFYSNPEPHP